MQLPSLQRRQSALGGAEPLGVREGLLALGLLALDARLARRPEHRLGDLRPVVPLRDGHAQLVALARTSGLLGPAPGSVGSVVADAPPPKPPPGAPRKLGADALRRLV